MATYGVNPRNLIDTGDELRQATRAIEGALNGLDGAVSTYHQSNSGDTAQAFQAAQQVWQNGVKEMNASLGQAALALGDISHEYVRTDRAGAASF